MTWHGDLTALQHLPALYYKRNYCIHVHFYLFLQVHVHLSIGLTVMHIRGHVNYDGFSQFKS